MKNGCSFRVVEKLTSLLSCEARRMPIFTLPLWQPSIIRHQKIEKMKPFELKMNMKSAEFQMENAGKQEKKYTEMDKFQLKITN
ncbi:MAG TPA: hypothetical protein VN922_01770 [Bacteroidia bacterium]|nr:hypothetical protein [Bacteroidia bacterium]